MSTSESFTIQPETYGSELSISGLLAGAGFTAFAVYRKMQDYLSHKRVALKMLVILSTRYFEVEILNNTGVLGKNIHFFSLQLNGNILLTEVVKVTGIGFAFSNQNI